MSPLRQLKNRKLLAGLALVGVLLAIGFWPSARPVDLGRAVRGTLRVTVDEEGETRVRDRFVVSAPVSGLLRRIELEPGDPVLRGHTVVATLVPAAPSPLDARTRAETEAAVAAARSNLDVARAQAARAQATVRLAESELQRQRTLQAQQVVSAQALEAKETEARTAAESQRAAEYSVASAEHQLQMARARLLQATGGQAKGRALELRSPIDGVVFKRLHESEAVVVAGEPLLEVGDPRRLEIVSDLLSADAVKVQPGAPVWLEQWGGAGPLRAQVRRVEPSGFMKISALGVEEQRVNVVMDFEDPLEAWSALGDGYRVEVRIVVSEGEDVLKIPTGSLFRRGDDWAVFAVEGGRARLRVVEVGRRNGAEAEVRSGLREGEDVVLHPSDTLRTGARVTPRAR